jgi:ankyrin repeat protein
MSDDDGNSPLHVAASNNQTGFCKLAFSLKEPSNDLRFMRNANGQTAAHVATEAMKRRIGPERHHVDKHSSTVSNPSNQKPTAENHGDDNHDDDDEDDDHDFGLPVLRDIWNNAKKGDARNCLFVRDFDRKTCLHLAAAQGTNFMINFKD